MDYEEGVLSILRGREGWDDEYSSIAEFKEHLNEAGLAEEEFKYKGWVMWRENERNEQQQQLQNKIITLLKSIASDLCQDPHLLVQFWGVEKVEGGPDQLSTSNYPFCVDRYLKKGVSWYRKVCMDLDAAEAEAEQLGGVERAYRNRHSESTPDLRLYSENEFPLRDEAARCGFTDYMALPIFDLHTQECYGVLELLSDYPALQMLPSSFHQDLKDLALRSSCCQNIYTDDIHQRLDKEITDILELAIRAVPQLSLAQVWIPCKQCPNIDNTNLCCMEMNSFISRHFSSDDLDSYTGYDYETPCYYKACKFHNLRLHRTCFLTNISDLTISNYPLVHYAEKARLSHCFATCLQSVTNSDDPFVIIQFFLRQKNSEDVCGDSSLHLILRIIHMKLKSFKIEQLPDMHLLVQSNTIESESIDMLLIVSDSYHQAVSEPDFTTFLETSCCQRPSEDSNGGWVFHTPVGAKLIENNSECDSLSMTTGGKIEQFMKKIADKLVAKYCIIQFWASKIVEKRKCLQTLDQPYVVGCLEIGLALFRKKCMKQYYFVDDEAKEEELGPPGRVFRYKHPEFTPYLSEYSTREFGMRNYALHCHLTGYFALPIYDKQLNECIGVLEFMGTWDGDGDDYNICHTADVEKTLKAADLSSSSANLRPRFKLNHVPANIEKALNEIKDVFNLIRNTPQLYLAKVWVPNDECASINSNVRYVELALTTEILWNNKPINQVHWINYVQPKKGMLGMVLQSENKSCFCPNLSEFSIADQPLALVEREKRLDVCFAICLQSSHTGDLLYVLEFFLIPGLIYLQSFFNFLLPILKQQLPSFKYASGKEIGEELVVEVIEFPETINPAFSDLGQLHVSPIKFKRVLYGQAEHQQTEDELEHCVSDAMQTEQDNVVASDLKTATNRGKRKISLHLSLEDLKPHFGKKLNDVAEELGVGRSTIKRACREFGIYRWPGNEKQARNPLLFERESARNPQQNMPPSSNSSLPQRVTSPRQNATRTNIESAQHVIDEGEADKVMVRVEYGDDTIKFEMCLSLGVNKLLEQVVRRLNLEIGSFKLKYVDEDYKEILIACDDDLHLCPKSQTATGKTCIQLFIPM